ncbi:hypothetical protein ACFWBH_01050 [Streptomyces sp. NPDC059999]|uniref:hypothetical protein n=1 Tax=Streptomyces sp. NPDC059999 TaxID=3347030 RepID=UPI0036A676DD
MRAATGLGVLGGSGSLIALAGAPWWAVVIGEAAAMIVAAIYLTFPQESGDRLEWWRLRWSPNTNAHTDAEKDVQRSQR